MLNVFFKPMSLLLTVLLSILTGCQSERTIRVEGQGTVEVMDANGIKTTCIGPATCTLPDSEAELHSVAIPAEKQWFIEWDELCSGNDDTCTIEPSSIGNRLVARFTQYYYSPSRFLKFKNADGNYQDLLQSGIKVYDQQTVTFRGEINADLQNISVLSLSPNQAQAISGWQASSISSQKIEFTFRVSQVDETQSSNFLILGTDNEGRDYAMPVTVSVFPRTTCAASNVGQHLPCRPGTGLSAPSAIYKSGNLIYQDHGNALYRFDIVKNQYLPGIEWTGSTHHFNPSTGDYFYTQDGLLFQNNILQPKDNPNTQASVTGDIISDDGNFLLVKSLAGGCEWNSDAYQLESYSLSGEFVDRLLIDCLPKSSYTVEMDGIVPLNQSKGFVLYRTTGLAFGITLNVHLMDESGQFNAPITIHLPTSAEFRVPGTVLHNSQYVARRHAVLSNDARYLSYGRLVLDLHLKTLITGTDLPFGQSSAEGFTDYIGGYKQSLTDSYVYPYRSYVDYAGDMHAIGTFVNPDGSITLAAGNHDAIIETTVTRPLNPDIDGDKVPNTVDRFPNDPMAWKDSDRDNFPDEWTEEYPDGKTQLGFQRHLDPLPDNPHCGTPEEVVDGQCLYDLTFTPEALQSGCDNTLAPQAYSRGHSFCNGYSLRYYSRGLAIVGNHNTDRVIRYLPLSIKWEDDEYSGALFAWNRVTSSIAMKVNPTQVMIYNLLTEESEIVQFDHSLSRIEPTSTHFVWVMRENDLPALLDMRNGTVTGVLGNTRVGDKEISFSEDIRFITTWNNSNNWVDLKRYSKNEDDLIYPEYEHVRWDNGIHYQRTYISGENNRIGWFTSDDYHAHSGDFPNYPYHCHIYDMASNQEWFTGCPNTHKELNGRWVRIDNGRFNFSPDGRYLGWFAGPSDALESEGHIWVKDLETDQVVISRSGIIDGNKCATISFSVDSSNVVCEGWGKRFVVNYSN